MAANRTLTEIQTSLEGQGVSVQIKELVEILELPAKSTGSTPVKATNKELKPKIEGYHAAKEAEKATVATAAKPALKTTNTTRNRARTVQNRRNSRRVTLDFNLARIDRATLRTIQDEVNAARTGMMWEAPEGWEPKKLQEGSARGTMRYNTPKGVVDNVPAGDIMQMKLGNLPWATPVVEASYSDRKRWAKMLADLSFQTKVCELCKKPIEEDGGPEMAMVYGLLDGRFVLPYINEPFPKRDSTELRFRRLHHLHSLWEDTLTKLLVRMQNATTEEIIADLLKEAEAVLARAERNRPGKYTLADVLSALEEVLKLWNGES